MKTPIDSYLETVPAAHREELELLRKQIRKLVPDAEEVISYMIPTFKWQGSLVGFASCKNHLSFYVMSGSLLSRFSEELKSYKQTKSAVHFTPEQRIPEDLLERMVRERISENAHITAVRAEKKRKKS